MGLTQKAAWRRVDKAVASGVLVRPKYCEKCFAPGPVHAHHDDYDKPLDVDWLCPDCHRDTHPGKTSRNIGTSKFRIPSAFRN